METLALLECLTKPGQVTYKDLNEVCLHIKMQQLSMTGWCSFPDGEQRKISKKVRHKLVLLVAVCRLYIFQFSINLIYLWEDSCVQHPFISTSLN